MQKDIFIAGGIVAACIAVTAAAFIAPHTDQPTKSDTGSLAKKPATVVKPLDLGTHRGSDTLPPIGDTVKRTPPDNTFTLPPPIDGGAKPSDPLRTLGGDTKPVPAFPSSDWPSGKPGDAWPGGKPGDGKTSPSAFTPTPSPAVPAIPVPPPSSPQEPQTHVVAKEETLGDISMKHYGTTKRWKEIEKANPGIDPNNLQVGQKLVIPVVETKVDAKPSTAPAAPVLAAGERAYTIKEGDSYYSIAQKELGNATRFKEIEKLNGTPGEELRVGQVIKLPTAQPKEAAPLPAPKAVVEQPLPPGAREHVVASGETLSDISLKYFNTTKRWQEIEKANPGIDSEKLKVGQKVIIPAGVAEPTKPELPSLHHDGGTTTEPAHPGEEEYVVKAGDRLQAIAKKYYNDPEAWHRIVAANPGIDPNNLQVGRKLRLPGGKAGDAEKPDKPTVPADHKPVPTGETVPAKPLDREAEKMRARHGDGPAKPTEAKTATKPADTVKTAAKPAAPVKPATPAKTEPAKPFDTPKGEDFGGDFGDFAPPPSTTAPTPPKPADPAGKRGVPDLPDDFAPRR